MPTTNRNDRGTANLPEMPEWDDREKLAAEKEVLGFYLTSHPLAEHDATLSAYCTHTTAAAATLPPRTEVDLGGMLASIKFSHTKNPRSGSTNTKYAMFDLEDMDGIMRCIIWPEEFANYGHLVAADAILVVRGAIDRRPGSEEANSDRQRADSARPARRPLHPRHRNPARRRPAHRTTA